MCSGRPRGEKKRSALIVCDSVGELKGSTEAEEERQRRGVEEERVTEGRRQILITVFCIQRACESYLFLQRCQR